MIAFVALAATAVSELTTKDVTFGGFALFLLMVLKEMAKGWMPRIFNKSDGGGCAMSEEDRARLADVHKALTSRDGGVVRDHAEQLKVAASIASSSEAISKSQEKIVGALEQLANRDCPRGRT